MSIKELIKEKLDRLKQLKAIVENDRNPKHWSFREHYACGHNNGYYHAINEGIEAIQQLKESLDQDVSDQREVLAKATEYDKLDHKFKLICGERVEQVLQHLCLFGFGDGITEQQALNKLAERFPMTTDQIVSTLEMSQTGVNHEPVEVEPYVAEFYEANKCDLEFAIYKAHVGIHKCEKPQNNPLLYWFGHSSNKPIETLMRMKTDGYTVVKKPLYIMPVPYTHNGTLHYCLKDNGEISFRQGNAYKFTKDQIKEYFPEIEDLAVEEEAE